MTTKFILTAIYNNPDNRLFPKSETIDYYHKADLRRVINDNLSREEFNILIITKVEEKS